MNRQGSPSSSPQNQTTFAPGCSTRLVEDGRRIIKVPETPHALATLQGQCSLTAALASCLNVSIPSLEAMPDGSFTYTILPGDSPSCLQDGASLKLYEDELGYFLACLHGITPESLAPAFQLHSSEASQARESFARNFAEVQQELVLPAHLIATARQLLDGDTWADRSVLVHGDLHEGNILMHGGHISAVLDWDSCHMGDPAEDFFFHLLGRGPKSLLRLLTSYEAHGSRTWPAMVQHIRLMLATYPIRYAARVLHSGQEGLLTTAQSFLSQPAEWTTSHRIALSAR